MYVIPGMGLIWNERANFSTGKAKIDNSDVCLAVFVRDLEHSS